MSVLAKPVVIQCDGEGCWEWSRGGEGEDASALREVLKRHGWISRQYRDNQPPKDFCPRCILLKKVK